MNNILTNLKGNISKHVVGKEDLVELFLIATMIDGHVLIEDLPGLGKTLLAKTFASSIDCEFKRIQFTPDVLPSDVLGFLYYNDPLKEFQFRKGPLFSNIILIDEINRATPKTQSSLLEAMEEKQISMDGSRYDLEEIFLVIATQNPIEQYGTYELPEAQLDRFLFKISMGYPTLDEEKNIIVRGLGFSKDFDNSILSKSDILELKIKCKDVKCTDEIMTYLLSIVRATRENPNIELGVSPRGSVNYYRACQARSILHGRDFIIPDDVYNLAVPILSHRIKQRGLSFEQQKSNSDLINEIIDSIPVPFDGDV